MPRNTETALNRDCGDTAIDAGRIGGQMGWYEFASDLVCNKTVLDAGSGFGEGLKLLNRTAAMAVGQDIDPRLESERVRVEALSDIGDKEFGAVVSIDVVEHVEEDHAFVRDLCRIAREFVFVTTPLWRLKRKLWPFHVREYSFQEFHDLAYPFGGCQFFKGDPSGLRYLKCKKSHAS